MKKLTEEQLRDLAAEDETGAPLKPYTPPEDWVKKSMASIEASLQKQTEEAQSLVKSLDKLAGVVSSSSVVSKKEGELLQRVLVEIARVLSERLAGLDASSLQLSESGALLVEILGKPAAPVTPPAPAKAWTFDVQRNENGFISKIEATAN